MPEKYFVRHDGKSCPKFPAENIFVSAGREKLPFLAKFRRFPAGPKSHLYGVECKGYFRNILCPPADKSAIFRAECALEFIFFSQIGADSTIIFCGLGRSGAYNDQSGQLTRRLCQLDDSSNWQ